LKADVLQPIWILLRWNSLMMVGVAEPITALSTYIMKVMQKVRRRTL